MGSMDTRGNNLSNMSVKVVRVEDGQVVAGSSWFGNVPYDRIDEVAVWVAKRIAGEMN